MVLNGFPLLDWVTHRKITGFLYENIFLKINDEYLYFWKISNTNQNYIHVLNLGLRF